MEKKTEPGKSKILPFPIRRRSPQVTPEMANMMRQMVAAGMNQHDVAAHFGVNQGRVSEAKKGKR